MKNDRIYEAIGAVDDELLERCEASQTPRKRANFRRWGILAACLCVIVVGATFLSNWLGDTEQDQPVNNGDLPLLSISDSVDGMGYEGFMAYDISELVNDNPWTSDAAISTLPVYKNSLAFDENYNVINTDFDAMKNFLLDIATRLGLDKNDLTLADDAPNETTKKELEEKYEAVGESVPEEYADPTSITGNSKGIEITVNNLMEATIEFTPAISLPDRYNFSYYDSSYKDMVDVAEYLKDEYTDLINMKNPEADIYGGDYSSNEESDIWQSYDISFFDAAGSIEDQIINYNFNRIDFNCDEHEELWLVRIFDPDLSQKTGDYPIITADEAAELLRDGYYITTVFEEMGEVVDVELVYRTGTYDEYYMPYYRFLVDLPEVKAEKGLKTYGTYYVPAVEQRYISDTTVWDGKFN